MNKMNLKTKKRNNNEKQSNHFFKESFKFFVYKKLFFWTVPSISYQI